MATKNNAANVTAGKPNVNGAFFRAPIGTTLPTDAKAELDEGFKCLGYISEDGFKHENSPSSEETKAWGGDVVASNQSEKSDKLTAKFIEATNVEVLKMVHGDDHVTGDLTTGIKVTSNAEELPEASYVIDMVMNKTTLKRVVVPRGKVSEIAEVTYADADLVGYETTITALPDADGNTHYEYMITKADE